MGLSIRFRGLIAQVTTLESVYTALAEDRYPVAVPEEVAAPARRAIERMLEA
jgi:quinolinate synthase